jgi:hypothetical protein
MTEVAVAAFAPLVGAAESRCRIVENADMVKGRRIADGGAFQGDRDSAKSAQPLGSVWLDRAGCTLIGILANDLSRHEPSRAIHGGAGQVTRSNLSQLASIVTPQYLGCFGQGRYWSFTTN